jgi:SAM-dependent methyltransferase
MKEARRKELAAIVKDNYQAIAKDFDMTRKKPLWPFLLAIGARIDDGQSVLDAGCGNGRLLQAVEGKNIDYVGFDSSQNLIDLAKANFGGSGREFVVADILDFDKLGLGRFDWIFSIAVIHHLPTKEDRLHVLYGLRQHLEDRGKLVISVWRPWGDKKLVRELFLTIGKKIIGQHPYAWNDLLFPWKNNQSPRYYHFFTWWELKGLARQAGLKIIEARKEKRNFYLVLGR